MPILGCITPYPLITLSSFIIGEFNIWLILPMSSFAAPIGNTVSSSKVIIYFDFFNSLISLLITLYVLTSSLSKLMNSSIFPLFLSRPIYTFSFSLYSLFLLKKKKCSLLFLKYFLLSVFISFKAYSFIALSSSLLSLSLSFKSPNTAKNILSSLLAK